MADTPQQASVFDSDQQQVGAVYAKALVGAAQKSGAADKILEEFEAFAQLLSELPKFADLLATPRVPSEVKVGLLDKSLQGKVSPTFLNFLKVVAEHSRMDCVGAIHHATVSALNSLTGRVEVLVTTAAELDAKTRSSLTSKLESSLGKKIDLKSEVDADLIGGIQVQIGDTVFDGSISARLKQMQESVARSTAEKLRDALDRVVLAD